MEKLKNPYFWLSVFALIFSAAGIDFEVDLKFITCELESFFKTY